MQEAKPEFAFQLTRSRHPRKRGTQPVRDNHSPPNGARRPHRRFGILVPFLKQACSWSPMSAICVQSFDDSLSPAIHTRYRISLRSSSMREPRYPLLRVVFWFRVGRVTTGVSANIRLTQVGHARTKGDHTEVGKPVIRAGHTRFWW